MTRLKDLAPVVYLSPSPNVLLAQQSLGVGSLNELIALAKSRTSKPLSYATVGRGSAHHFCMELLKSQAGIDLLHVPYRGVAPAVLAVTRGEVDLYCSDIPGALNLIKGGKVVPLGITSVKRAPTLAEIPAFSEAGLPDYSATGYVGIMVTGRTSADVVQKLNTAINEVIRDPDFSRRFSEFGYEMVGGTVADFATFLKDDIARYLRITKDAGIAPE
jgi:tripartite-type tricarboxylate transporter receptor subunit TctC